MQANKLGMPASQVNHENRHIGKEKTIAHIGKRYTFRKHGEPKKKKRRKTKLYCCTVYTVISFQKQQHYGIETNEIESIILKMN